MLMPAVTASPVLTQGATGTPGSSAAAAAAAAAAIMQNGAATVPQIGSCAAPVIASTPGIQQVRFQVTKLRLVKLLLQSSQVDRIDNTFEKFSTTSLKY